MGYLYRGVNVAQHRANRGRIFPKAPGPFEHTFLADGTIRADGSATCGPSAQNAVLLHQLNQAGHPTAGISTTPHLEQARYYATWGGQPGVIYVIDRAKLPELGVREFIVKDTVNALSLAAPADDEVILVAPGDGELPPAAIVEVLDALMLIKVYCERSAMREWLADLKRQGTIVLVHSPYDNDGRLPRRMRPATPSVVTADATAFTADMTIPISDMVESEKCEDIRRIIRRDDEELITAEWGIIGKETEGDARHLDSAYKSACRAFLTTDKYDILRHAAKLEALLGFRLFHPDEDRDRFLAFVADFVTT